MKILWIIPKWTLPAIDGARVATERLIRNTIHAGAEVSVLCLAQDSEEVNLDEMKSLWNTKDIKVIRRDIPKAAYKKGFYYLKSLLMAPLTPITFSSFTKRNLKNQIHQAIKNETYDIMLLDCLHLGAPFIENGKFKKPAMIKKVIYRAHNLEVDLWRKYVVEESNILKKILLWYQSKLVLRWETLILKAANGIAPIANEDLKDLQSLAPFSKYQFTPLGLDFMSPLSYSENEKTQLLFIGRLDWPPNKEGLKWFLTKIWPEVLAERDDLVLNIVGSGDRKWLKSYEGLQNVVMHGFVPDIKDIYKLSDFTIAPIHFGSGTRIKVIESYAFGRNIISSKMGAQGSGLSSCEFILCESDKEWIDTLKVIRLDDKYKAMSSETNKKLSKIYDERLVGEEFYLWLKTFL